MRNSAVAGGNHATAGSAFLSCARAKRTEGSDFELGVTVDQIAARQVGGATPIPSLEIGTDLIAQVGNCDNGFACVYQNNLSWASATAPLPSEADPERCSSGCSATAARRMRAAPNCAATRAFSTGSSTTWRGWKAGSAPRIAGGWASISTRCARSSGGFSRPSGNRWQSPLPALKRPASIPADWEDHVKLMCDLQVLALQTDMTRIVTFQLAREGSTRTYPQIGVPEPHHPVSHHTNDPEKLAKLAKINAYHVSLFAYLLERLKATPDGDGTLLDHSTYLFGSGMGNPDIHDHRNLPIVVARGGIGGVKGGYHLRYPDETPLANLHLTLLDGVGVHLDNFVDSTGRAGVISEPLSL